MHRISSMAALVAVALAPQLASAETQTPHFDPQIDWRPTEFPFESGYIPADGPLRINLEAAAFQEVTIAMEGEAAYDFDALELAYHGRDDGGLFRNTLGAEVTATVAIDAFGFQTEFEVGIWDIAENADATFDPYLLQGNPQRPVTVAEEIGPFNLVDTPFSVGPATGTLVIDYAFDVPGISFAGTQIDLDTAMGEGEAIASHTIEDQALPVMLPPASSGETTSAYATMNGEFSSAVVLHLYPTVTIDVFGAPVAIGPFDVAIDYPVVDAEPVVFDDIELQYDVPEPPAPDPTEDDGGADGTSGGGGEDTGTDGGGEETGAADSDGGADDADDDAAGESSGSGSAGEATRDGDQGCGCASERSPRGALLLLVGLIALRRRRSPS